MKYLVRSIKYFFRLLVILAVIICALILLKLVDADLSTMFVNGYDSLWQIAVLMAVFAGLYPHFGYVTRSLFIPGETGDIRPEVESVMASRGYVISGEDGENITFVKRRTLDRMLKMYEDSLTFTRTATGYDIEGAGKDVLKVLAAIENSTNSNNNP